MDNYNAEPEVKEAVVEEAVEAVEAVEVAETEPATPKEVILEVANPNKEEMREIAHTIKADYDYQVDVKPVTFNFKKSKDKDTGIETIRKPVDLAIPYPSVNGIVCILENTDREGVLREGDNKGLELLQEAVANVINAQARELLYDDTSLTAATFPVEKLSWQFIANIPKVQRRGGGIPKETWELFTTDYIEVMPEATGKTLEAVGNMAKILLNKLSQVKTNTEVLELVVEQLAIYCNASENADEYKDCIAFLLTKADAFLNITPEELLANL